MVAAFLDIEGSRRRVLAVYYQHCLDHWCDIVSLLWNRVCVFLCLGVGGCVFVVGFNDLAQVVGLCPLSAVHVDEMLSLRRRVVLEVRPLPHLELFLVQALEVLLEL